MVIEQLVMVTTLVPVKVRVVSWGDGVAGGGVQVMGVRREVCGRLDLLELELETELRMDEATLTGQTVVRTLTVAVT